MQQKKIVHLISSLKIGGAESLLGDLIIGLGTEQYEHQVIYFHDGPHAQRLRDYGVPVYQVKGLVCLYDPVFFWRLWHLIKKINPDLMHTALWAANFAGRIMGTLLRIPVICVIHLGVDLDGRVRNMLDAVTFRLATKVIAVSQGVEQSLHAKKNWVPATRLTTIANGIDAAAIIERASRQHCSRKEIGIKDDAVAIGAVGRFVPRKNFGLLIEAFVSVYAQHKQAHLMLVGLGEQEAELRTKVTELGLSGAVTFVVGKSAYGYYPLFDCFVLNCLALLPAQVMKLS
jgi:glycosyltransferase involved in cell wall biosynthesis